MWVTRTAELESRIERAFFRQPTLHQWRTQVRFEIPAEIPFAHELLMKMLQENVKIKKIYWGNLLLVYIYTKNLTSLKYKIFLQKLIWVVVSTPIRRI